MSSIAIFIPVFGGVNVLLLISPLNTGTRHAVSLNVMAAGVSDI